MNELYCNKLVSSYEGTHPKKKKSICAMIQQQPGRWRLYQMKYISR